MGKWKIDDELVSNQTLYMREWSETKNGKAYKERHKDYAKQWRLDNRDKAKAIQKRSMYEARMEVLQHYSGLETPECKCCKEQMFEFLQIDHIEGNGAGHRRSIGMAQGDLNQVAKQKERGKISLGGNGFIYWLKKNNFPEGFQVLCANCNLGKRTNKYCPHEIQNGMDMYGNTIAVQKEEFPELTRRRRGEAQKEADELGVNVSTLRMRRWTEKQRLLNPKPEKIKLEPTACGKGHVFPENLYQREGDNRRYCKQCKRDSKARRKECDTLLNSELFDDNEENQHHCGGFCNCTFCMDEVNGVSLINSATS